MINEMVQALMDAADEMIRAEEVMENFITGIYNKVVGFFKEEIV